MPTKIPKPFKNPYMDTLEEVQEHQKNSENSLSTARSKWDDYDSLVVAEHREAMQNDSRVFDPRLSTIEIERTARVAAQRPSGKAKAVSKNDTGKNLVMNLLLPFQMNMAKEQRSFLIKQMQLSFWSRVYGSLYALVPWRVRQDYVGPELMLLPIRHSYPQPNVTTNDSDWFISYNRLSIHWLKKQAEASPDVWKKDEITQLANEMRQGKDSGDIRTNDNRTSYVDSTGYPSNFGDTTFPFVDTYTEYRKDKWITWAKRINPKKGREYMLREVDNSNSEVYPNHLLPVIEKVSFPMLDGKLGVGPFQRGKSLQFATNSLINLRFSGLRSAVFPERMVNPDNVVMSSLKFGPSEMWFMNQPGQDVQIVNRGPDAGNAFNEAYGLLVSAMLNQAGTTDTSNTSQVESSLGKTPQALRLQAAAQGAQDFWEQTMLEDALQGVFERWVAMNVRYLDSAVAVRIFGDDIKEIGQQYPDALELFSDSSGVINVDKNILNDVDEVTEFDYEIETGSTAKPDMNKEVADLTDLLNLVGERPQLLDLMNQQTQETVNVSELMKQIAMKKGAKNIDKIIIKTPQMPQQGMEGQQMPEQVMGAPTGQPMAPQMPQYQDPQINELAQQLLGGMGGIPQS